MSSSAAPPLSTPLPSCAVVVSSCDAYADLWPYFFHFFFRCWPDAPLPVYLIANERRYLDPRVKTILVGSDRQWGSNTRTAVSQVDTELIFMLLDDFFFNALFPVETFQRTLDQFQAAQGRLLELRLHGSNGEKIPGTWFRRSDPQNLCSGINSNLWRKELLMEVAQVGLNIWQCESLVRKILRDGEKRFFFMDEDAPKQISFVEGVRGSFWKPEGLAYMRSNGIEPDLKRRPCPPVGEGIWAKMVRSVQKRRMHLLRAKQLAHPLADVHPLDGGKYPIAETFA